MCLSFLAIFGHQYIQYCDDQRLWQCYLLHYKRCRERVRGGLGSGEARRSFPMCFFQYSVDTVKYSTAIISACEKATSFTDNAAGSVCEKGRDPKKLSKVFSCGYFFSHSSDTITYSTAIISACEKATSCTSNAVRSICEKGWALEKRSEVLSGGYSFSQSLDIVKYRTAVISACDNATFSTASAAGSMCIKQTLCHAPLPSMTDGEATNPGPGTQRLRRRGPRTQEARARRLADNQSQTQAFSLAPEKLTVWHVNMRGVMTRRNGIDKLAARIRLAEFPPNIIGITESWHRGGASGGVQCDCAPGRR